MTSSERDPRGSQGPFNLLLAAAWRAARSLARDLNELEQLQSAPESVRRFAEAGRERARDILRESLAEARPAYGWIDELGETIGKDPRRVWAVAPVSGMANFTAGRPGFAVLAAYADRGAVQAGAIVDPATGEVFSARAGEGARRDRFRLRLATAGGGHPCPAVAAPLANADSPLSGRLFRDLQTFARLGFGIRGTGSTALDWAWVAAGRLQGAWTYGPPGIAERVGALLVREAGGRAGLAKRPVSEDAPNCAAAAPTFDMLAEALNPRSAPPG